MVWTWWDLQGVSDHAKAENHQGKEVASIASVSTEYPGDGFVVVFCDAIELSFWVEHIARDSPLRATMFHAVGLKATAAMEYQRDGLDQSTRDEMRSMV